MPPVAFPRRRIMGATEMTGASHGRFGGQETLGLGWSRLIATDDFGSRAPTRARRAQRRHDGKQAFGHMSLCYLEFRWAPE